MEGRDGLSTRTLTSYMPQSHRPTCCTGKTTQTLGSAVRCIYKTYCARGTLHLKMLNCTFTNASVAVGVGYNGILLQLSTRQVRTPSTKQAWPQIHKHMHSHRHTQLVDRPTQLIYVLDFYMSTYKYERQQRAKLFTYSQLQVMKRISLDW